MNDKILTIKDLLDFLNNEVDNNPEALNYQLARYDYDDFSVSYTGFTFGCSNINLYDLPKEDDLDTMEGIDSDLISTKILTIS